MIHSARPMVTPVANIVFILLGRTTCAKTMTPTGRDFGLAEWINYYITVLSTLIQEFKFKQE